MNVLELAANPAAASDKAAPFASDSASTGKAGTSSFEQHLSKEVQDQKNNTQTSDSRSESQTKASGQNTNTADARNSADKTKPSSSQEAGLNSPVSDDVAVHTGSSLVESELRSDLASEIQGAIAHPLRVQSLEDQNLAQRHLEFNAELSLNDTTGDLQDAELPVLAAITQPLVAAKEGAKLSPVHALDTQNLRSNLDANGLANASAVGSNAVTSKTADTGLEIPSTTLNPRMQGEALLNTTQNPSSTKLGLDANIESSSNFNAIAELEGLELKPATQARSDLANFSLSKVEEGLVAQQGRFSVNVQFGRAEWFASVAEQVSKVAAQNLNFAEIQLDPPELGALQVRVQVNNDQATVSFSAQSSQVRDALEQHGQRLRELFDAEGMNLVDVDVRDQNQQNTRDELESERAGSQISAEDGDESVLSDASVLEADIQVGVDDYV